jgi:DNA-binding MarR family transcriptional regulator
MPASDPAPGAVLDPRRELGIELGRHARLLHVVRNRMTEGAPHGLDFAALSLLMTLIRCGPRRQGELAENAMLDPSTTSRYVAQLVRAGLVTRRPDPMDGRAVQLIASTAGEQVAGELIERRDTIVGGLLAHWAADDVANLTLLLRRLNDGLDQLRPSIHLDREQ